MKRWALGWAFVFFGVGLRGIRLWIWGSPFEPGWRYHFQTCTETDGRGPTWTGATLSGGSISASVAAWLHGGYKFGKERTH